MSVSVFCHAVGLTSIAGAVPGQTNPQMNALRSLAMWILAVIFLIGTSASQNPLDEYPIVHTRSGDVRGQAFKVWRYFQRIPFAAPPIGAQRWRSPQPAPHWRGVRDATQPAPACMQASVPRGSGGMDEDCLYLNVMTPLDARPGSNKPVIVWIFGGGGTAGAGSDYDAHRMVEQGDVIFVTINYRLGIFGFFGFPGLADSGTFGMQDQIAAFQWVRMNARAFGGDPHNITAAGESEGAISICGLLTSPSARHAFDKAIIESGSCHTLYYDVPLFHRDARSSPLRAFVPATQVRANGLQFATDQAEALKCPGTFANELLNCLRGVKAKDLNSSNTAEILAKGIGFGSPAYSSRILPENPPNALERGKFYHLPVLSGINRNEDRSIVMLNEYLAGSWRITPDDYGRLLQQRFLARAPLVAARYPLIAYPSAAMAWSALETDETFVCPQLETEHNLANHMQRRFGKRLGRAPIFAYEFADETSPSGVTYDPELTNIHSGAAHVDELLYILDLVGLPRVWNGPQLKYPWLTSEQEDLAKTMIQYWAQSARTGDPNADGLPNWPRTETIDHPGSTLRLDIVSRSGIGAVDVYSDHQCSFWAPVL